MNICTYVVLRSSGVQIQEMFCVDLHAVLTTYVCTYIRAHVHM